MTDKIINHAAVLLPFTTEDMRRILLQRKDSGYPWNPGQWCFFGGKIETDEPADGVETVRREIGEELGLVIEPSDVRYLWSRNYHDVRPSDGKRREGTYQVFACDFNAGDLSRLRLREGAGFSLYQREELWELNMVPHNKDVALEVYRSMPFLTK